MPVRRSQAHLRDASVSSRCSEGLQGRERLRSQTSALQKMLWRAQQVLRRCSDVARNNHIWAQQQPPKKRIRRPTHTHRELRKRENSDPTPLTLTP